MAGSGFGEPGVPAEHTVGQRLARLALRLPGTVGFKWKLLTFGGGCTTVTFTLQVHEFEQPAQGPSWSWQGWVGCRQPGAEFPLCTQHSLPSLRKLQCCSLKRPLSLGSGRTLPPPGPYLAHVVLPSGPAKPLCHSPPSPRLIPGAWGR